LLLLVLLFTASLPLACIPSDRSPLTTGTLAEVDGSLLPGIGVDNRGKKRTYAQDAQKTRGVFLDTTTTDGPGPRASAYTIDADHAVTRQDISPSQRFRYQQTMAQN
jgi:hypothetical protein